MSFGSARNTRSLTDGRTNPALSLRYTGAPRSSSSILSFDKSPPLSAARSSRTPGLSAASLPRASAVRDFGSSRYTDGRNTLYRPPTSKPTVGHRPFRSQHSSSMHHPHYRYHRQPYWFNPYSFSYHHYGFAPALYPAPYYNPYYNPYYYPSSGIGFSWFSGSFGLSFFSYTPAYSTRYYDSWHSGGWGYSRIYYDGWRNGWYGGISYIYNPWPVYRTTYLYEPAPTVIRTETVYVTQPSTVTYVTAQTPAASSQPYAQASAAATAPIYWDSAPAEERIETLATRCFCRCGCHGQQPCTCEYPCGAEYAYQPEYFDLSLEYVSYAETLDPETIWLSYSGLDYWETDTKRYNSESTAAY